MIIYRCIILFNAILVSDILQCCAATGLHNQQPPLSFVNPSVVPPTMDPPRHATVSRGNKRIVSTSMVPNSKSMHAIIKKNACNNNNDNYWQQISVRERALLPRRRCATISLRAFSSRSDNNDYDDDDDEDGDDEPPNLSSTPQEFLERMKQKEDQNQKHNNNNNNNKNSKNYNENNLDSAPAYGPGRGRSAPQIRPAFGAKKSSSGKGSSNNNMATVYVCTNCGSEYVQWRGRCGTCLEWNTVQEFRASRKPAPLGSGGGGGMMRPTFSNNKDSGKGGGSFQKSGSSWLDGIDNDSFLGSSRGDGRGGGSFGGGGGGGGPVRVTDVYQEILPSGDKDDASWKEAYSKGRFREQRTLVPDDSEMNTVLGGGIMPGSLILVGGDPGMTLFMCVL